jgi:plastocyanin
MKKRNVFNNFLCLLITFFLIACSSDYPENDSYSEPKQSTPTSNATNFNVTNSSSSAYVFNNAQLVNVNNPNITLQRGKTYTFNVNTPGHPFLIKTERTTGSSSNYNSGMTNNGATSGNVTFAVPSDAPSTLYYICEFHSSMSGVITITN